MRASSIGDQNSGFCGEPQKSAICLCRSMGWTRSGCLFHTRVMSSLIPERVELARRGLSPHVICRLRSGWVVMGDSQFIRGYCLLLPDPVVGSLNDLTLTDRAQFLVDMVAIGDALLAVTNAYRINYEILGNTDPWLHAHIFPRRRRFFSTGFDGGAWRIRPSNGRTWTAGSRSSRRRRQRRWRSSTEPRHSASSRLRGIRAQRSVGLA